MCPFFRTLVTLAYAHRREPIFPVHLTKYFAHPLGRGRVGCAAPNLGAGVSQNHFGFLPTDQGIPLGHVLHGVYPGRLVAAGNGRQLDKVGQYLRLNGCLW